MKEMAIGVFLGCAMCVAFTVGCMLIELQQIADACETIARTIDR